MPSDDELDDSWAVTLLTGLLYVGWLSLLSYAVLWLGIEPLASIEQHFGGWPGTVTAVGVGVVFIATSRFLYDAVRKRNAASIAAASTAPVPDASPDSTPPAEDPQPPEARSRRKRRKKKKKKKR